MTNEAAYWITLAHIPRWGYVKTNSLVIKFFHDQNISISRFFELPESEWENVYGLNEEDRADLNAAKADLSNNAFLAEQLENEGYELIPVTSSEYPKTLKENLKVSHAPTLLYVKGNKQILQEKSVAIVGSRDASELSLHFTDNIARKVSKDFKVIVSGFAKGVDKQALDSAIKYIGQSIIVLPQGIMTFGSGFKTYYKQIVDGDVLVLSTFHPRAPWKAELAMARNSIIYGLAAEIYVAESSDKGGTWSGVIDGLRKKRKIYVRQPEAGETNANEQLIEKGAIAVDFEGNPLNVIVITPEQTAAYKKNVLDLLKRGTFTTKEIISKTELPWNESEVLEFLKSQREVEIINKKPVRFTFKQQTLFD